MVGECHSSTNVDKENEGTKKTPHLHESSSESAMKWVVSKSASELRDIGDCCFRRQSLGKLATGMESSMQKAKNRRSDSYLHYHSHSRSPYPSEYLKMCQHCDGHTESAGTSDEGLRLRSRSHDCDHKSNDNTSC